MFVAKFSQIAVDNKAGIIADKNTVMPYIGEVVAGKSIGTFINGTIFEREGLKPNKLYACENITEEYEGTQQVRVQVLAEVSILEFIPLKKELGAPVLNIVKSEAAVEEEVDFNE